MSAQVDLYPYNTEQRDQEHGRARTWADPSSRQLSSKVRMVRLMAAKASSDHSCKARCGLLMIGIRSSFPFCILLVARPVRSSYRIETFPSYNGSREADNLCCGGRPGYFPPGSPSSGRGQLQRATLLDRQSSRGGCRTTASGAVSAGHHGAWKRRSGTLPPDPEFAVAGTGPGDFPHRQKQRGGSCSEVGVR